MDETVADDPGYVPAFEDRGDGKWNQEVAEFFYNNPNQSSTSTNAKQIPIESGGTCVDTSLTEDIKPAIDREPYSGLPAQTSEAIWTFSEGSLIASNSQSPSIYSHRYDPNPMLHRQQYYLHQQQQYFPHTSTPRAIHPYQSQFYPQMIAQNPYAQQLHDYAMPMLPQQQFSYRNFYSASPGIPPTFASHQNFMQWNPTHENSNWIPDPTTKKKRGRKPKEPKPPKDKVVKLLKAKKEKKPRAPIKPRKNANPEATARRMAMCYEKGTRLMVIEENIADERQDAIWVVNNYQLLQKYELERVGINGERIYVKTMRFIPWLCDEPWSYLPLDEYISNDDGEFITLKQLPETSEIKRHVEEARKKGVERHCTDENSDPVEEYPAVSEDGQENAGSDVQSSPSNPFLVSGDGNISS